MVETIFTLVVCGLTIYAFWQQRKPPSQRRASALARQSRAVSRHTVQPARAPLGVLLRLALQHHAGQVRGFVDGLRGKGQPATMSSPLLATTPDLGYEPLDLGATEAKNEERRTKNEAAPAQNDDMPISKNRLAAILKLAAGGVDQETILAVYRKEPAAIVSALKVVRGYQVAHLMGGAYADNLKEIERVLAVRAAEVAE